ncbi:ESPR domain-containing protein [Gallibacterium melopsittaci]|uniref:ESPR domain-containing protein n=1 Tax=Gallibacterium melopsittaci TaxID=516063 RepID=A0ABV6HUB7_9PAST
MNKIYRIVWNVAKGAWQCVSELGKSHGKKGSSVVTNGQTIQLITLGKYFKIKLLALFCLSAISGVVVAAKVEQSGAVGVGGGYLYIGTTYGGDGSLTAQEGATLADIQAVVPDFGKRIIQLGANNSAGTLIIQDKANIAITNSIERHFTGKGNNPHPYLLRVDDATLQFGGASLLKGSPRSTPDSANSNEPTISAIEVMGGGISLQRILL